MSTILLSLISASFYWTEATAQAQPCDRNELEKHFFRHAHSLKPVTDKVTTHQYETMYGTFVVPLCFATHTPKLLEIGLGCDMKYGPGASATLWKSLLPEAELWEAEYDADCVKHSKLKGQLDGIKTLTGDQGNFTVLDSWVEQLGTDFDVIIDDGGHTNSQIGHSFEKLWPLVRLGGVYVIEDLQVGRTRRYDDTGGRDIMADKLKDWIEQLITSDASNKITHPIPPDVAFVFCQLEACVIGKRNSHIRGAPGNPGHDFPTKSIGPGGSYNRQNTCDRNELEKQFFLHAHSLKPVTDKVTTHQYETMYGTFVVPLRFATHTPKLLEIGLGCDMNYGPGASATLWKSLLPEAELWEAEYNADCVKKSKLKGQLDGIKTLTGDQGNFAVLDSWVEQLGTDFDVIIDDGGHTNSQIGHSFEKLWPLVRLGGVYVIEDLQVGRTRRYDDTGGRDIMADKLKDWIEQLITSDASNKITHPIPADVAFVFCQLEACVIGKRNSHTRGAPGNPGHDFGVAKTKKINHGY